MSDKVQYAHDELSRLLNLAERVFKRGENMKLTLVCRHATDDDCYIVLTADDLCDVIDCIKRSERGPIKIEG